MLSFSLVDQILILLHCIVVLATQTYHCSRTCLFNVVCTQFSAVMLGITRASTALKPKSSCLTPPRASPLARSTPRKVATPSASGRNKGVACRGKFGVRAGRLAASLRKAGASRGKAAVTTGGKGKVRRFVAPARGADIAPGPASESDLGHRKRHPRPVAGCARCVYEQRRRSLELLYGSYNTAGGGDGNASRVAVWLAPRPARYGGRWGVGCICCARLLDSITAKVAEAQQSGSARQKAAKRGPANCNTKWARFEVTDALQIAARGLKQHQQTLQHRKAVRAMNAPPELQERVVLSMDDADLFRGGVPQPTDYVQSWSACQCGNSFRAAEKHGTTLDWMQGQRKIPVLRRAFAAIVRIMALNVRMKRRERLQQASAISIGLDDRGAYRVITYRCDTPWRAEGVGVHAGSGWTSGCLGVLRRGGVASTKTLADTDDDYSKAMADSVVRAFRFVATDDGVCDDAVVTRMLKCVRIGIADGAASAQKCLRFLASGAMPNMLVVGRDPAHALRIATRDPLLASEAFAAWWKDVFDSKEALVPSIQNSEEWSERLLLCQREVLRSRGEQGAGLKVVAKCMQFAKQRFDSVATPMRQFCCLLTAIAMLLAHAATDTRGKAPVRARARRRLQELPDHIPTAGLCATYAEESIRFVRLFDKSQHDPARTWGQLRKFTADMHTLFCEGHIWSEGTGASRSEQTFLETVIHEAKSAPTIYYGEDGRVLRLFQRPSVEQQQWLQASVHQVTRAMLDRVEVEIGIENAMVLFTALDLGRWHQALMSGRQGQSDQLDLLRRHARRLLAVWRVFSDASMAELEGIAIKLVRDNRVAIAEGKIDDYRSVWVQALQPNFRPSLGAGVGELIRIYMAALDGTCGVERDLGVLTRVLQAHSGPTDEDGHTMSHCVELLLDGPVAATEIAVSPVTGKVGAVGESPSKHVLLPTEFSRECARLWVRHHGRRFRIYRRPDRLAGRGPREGTMTAVVRGAARATAHILRQAREGNGAERTVLGVSRHRLVAAQQLPQPTKKLNKFLRLTSKKRKRLEYVQEARSTTRATSSNPYTFGDLDPNRKLRRGQVLTASPRPTLPAIVPRNGVICVASCSGQVVPPAAGYEILQPAQASSAASALEQLMRAQIIVWDATWQLDGAVDEKTVISSIVAVGMGKAVLNRARWHGSRPHTNVAVLFFQPAAKLVKAVVVLGGELVSRHGAVCAALQSVAKRGTMWTVLREGSAGAEAAEATKLFTLRAVRDFVRQSRRVCTHRPGLVWT